MNLGIWGELYRIWRGDKLFWLKRVLNYVFIKGMNVVFRFVLAMIFLAVASMPDFIASEFSGVRQIEFTHTHAEHGHHHDHDYTEHSESHHHDEDSLDESDDVQMEATQHASDSSNSHTHQVVLVGIHALLSYSDNVLSNNYQTPKFPFPKDLVVPLSQDLASIFRPPISA